jgi:hypothetical protein
LFGYAKHFSEKQQSAELGLPASRSSSHKVSFYSASDNVDETNLILFLNISHI